MTTKQVTSLTTVLVLLMLMLLSACQPIQPPAGQAAPMHNHATDHPTADEAAAAAGAAPYSAILAITPIPSRPTPHWRKPILTKG
ncbi:MAG: hypothetical protein R3C14_23765 [Caldilineaceae bacterium]